MPLAPTIAMRARLGMLKVTSSNMSFGPYDFERLAAERSAILAKYTSDVN